MSGARDVVLALDVDGVVLDATRGGQGSWQTDLEARFGITPEQLRSAFFERSWGEIVVGRRPVEPALREALAGLGAGVEVEEVLRCWFDADFWPNEAMVARATRWSRDGVRVALVTNQEHRRAAYLRRRLGEVVPFDAIVYSAELGCTKDDPDFYVRATARLAADEVVFVDDDPRNVEVASQAGWTALVYHDEPAWWPTLDEALLRALGPR